MRTAKLRAALRQLYVLIKVDQFRSGAWGSSLETTSALYGRPADPGSISVSAACSEALSTLSPKIAEPSVLRFRRYLASRRLESGGFGMLRSVGSSQYPRSEIQAHARHTAAAVKYFLRHDGPFHEAVTAGTRFLLHPSNRTEAGLWVDHGEKTDRRVDPVTVSAVVGTLEAVRAASELAGHSIGNAHGELEDTIRLGLGHLVTSPYRLDSGFWIYRFENSEERSRLAENSYRYTAGILFEVAAAALRTGIGLPDFREVSDHLALLLNQYGGTLPAGPAASDVSFDATANMLTARSMLDQSEISPSLAVSVLKHFARAAVCEKTFAPDWAALVRLAAMSHLDPALGPKDVGALDALVDSIERDAERAHLPQSLRGLRSLAARLIEVRRRIDGPGAAEPASGAGTHVDMPQSGYTHLDRKLAQVRATLSDRGAATEDNIGALMTVLATLANLAGSAVQDAIFPVALDEAAIQSRVRETLRSNPLIGAVLEEQPQVGGGRADLSFRGIRIELKAERERPLRPSDCRRFADQAAAYALATGQRIGILCVVDTSPKSAPPFPVEDGIFVQSVRTSGTSAYIVTVLVQGGLPKPSSLSRGKRRTRT